MASALEDYEIELLDAAMLVSNFLISIYLIKYNNVLNINYIVNLRIKRLEFWKFLIKIQEKMLLMFLLFDI
jgi:hypothetical protein